MAIKSMTGFGRSEFNTPHGPVRVEIKTTNHKFFELAPRLPDDLVSFTDAIRKLVQKRIKRGKTFLMMNAPEGLLTPGTPHLDEALAQRYLHILKRLNKTLGFKTPITLQQMIGMPDVISYTVTKREVNRTWSKARQAVVKAVQELERSRAREGQVLMRDMLRRTLRIRTRLSHIRKRGPQVVQRYRQRARERIMKEESDKTAAMERLQAETAAFAKNSDITEEAVRLSSHIDSFRAALKEKGEIGRRLDFIAQEMIREANTMGAKSNDFAISNHVVHIKAELEKIREQGQNVE